ncbi:MAG: hypothetical protein K0R38_5741 [Polyangiaceae bacterium]|nr:hypothetical protein [Polyangiaceae bacterium]
MARRVIVGGALALVAPVISCGDYSADPPAAGGSTSAAAGSVTGGSAGSIGVIPGGASGAGGTSGSAGSGSPGAGGRETPPEASCESVTACGGEVAGVWFATSSCLPVTGMADLAELGIGCKVAPVSGKLAVTGNLTLGADGMLSDNTTTTGDVVMELVPECLDVSGTKTKCDRISSPLSAAGFSDITCVDSTMTTGGCTCTGKVMQMGSLGWMAFDPPKMGTYKTASNVLTLTTSVKALDYAYCVEGNFMKVTPSTKTVLGQVAGTVVFQKQP